MLKKYIAREPEVNVVSTGIKHGGSHEDTDPELGEVPDLEGYHRKEGVQDVRIGEDLSETSDVC